MAKKSMLNREVKRASVAARFATKRLKLKEILRNPKSSPAEREEAQLKFQALPRDASPSRKRNRCSITGRSRGYYRKFGLSRTKLREATMKGEIPGLGKASW
jgi:small subunit ribosomal protein S14